MLLHAPPTPSSASQQLLQIVSQSQAAQVLVQGLQEAPCLWCLPPVSISKNNSNSNLIRKPSLLPENTDYLSTVGFNYSQTVQYSVIQWCELSAAATAAAANLYLRSPLAVLWKNWIINSDEFDLNIFCFNCVKLHICVASILCMVRLMLDCYWLSLQFSRDQGRIYQQLIN